MDLGEYKDASGLHIANVEDFKENLQTTLKNAVPLVEQERIEAAARAREAWKECEELAHEHDILELFATELVRSGVAGESRVVKLLYLAVTSRFLARPPGSG